MVITDPIADMLNRIKTASRIGKPSSVMPYSKMREAIADTLVKAGFLKAVSKHGKKVAKTLEVELLYTPRGPRITETKRVSRPSRRMYRSVSELRAVRNGIGAGILSTPQGILTDKEARMKQVGGEYLFEIW